MTEIFTTKSVAFLGTEATEIDVQIRLSSSAQSVFHIVGLADKAIHEAKERVRAALGSIGAALPATGRVLVNLAPADLPKEGSRYDLPIALGLLAALGLAEPKRVQNILSVGELSLNGDLRRTNGILPAALVAAAGNYDFMCAPECAEEAQWALDGKIYTPKNLQDFILFDRTGDENRVFSPVTTGKTKIKTEIIPDLIDVRGQENAKRALEITAAGGHNLLMSGPPGAGKSMLAARLPGILPPPNAEEVLEISMIASVAGNQTVSGPCFTRPFRAPHHTASAAALIGGGRHAEPGEITFAHKGVLFLDELPEFKADVLDALRQPLETGKASVARAERRVTHPADFQLIAAMNPCKCGYLYDAAKACSKAPFCGKQYTSRISGPLLDRFDLYIELATPKIKELSAPQAGETSADIRKRVYAARARQKARAEACSDLSGTASTNARAGGDFLEKIAISEERASEQLKIYAEKAGISARSYFRILKTARTISDLRATPDTPLFIPLNEKDLLQSLSYRTRH